MYIMHYAELVCPICENYYVRYRNQLKRHLSQAHTETEANAFIQKLVKRGKD